MTNKETVSALLSYPPEFPVFYTESQGMDYQPIGMFYQIRMVKLKALDTELDINPFFYLPKQELAHYQEELDKKIWEVVDEFEAVCMAGNDLGLSTV